MEVKDVCASKPGQRRVMLVDFEETVVIQLGQESPARKLVLNPKQV
jgi:hypothetical protein